MPPTLFKQWNERGKRDCQEAKGRNINAGYVGDPD
jgi:hypothetical protein